MNKLLRKIAGVALGLTMAIGVGVAVASNSEAVPVHATDGTVTLSSGTYSGSGTSGIITWSTTHLVVVQSRVSGTNVNSSYVSAPRWYQGNKATFTPQSGYSINSVTVTATSSAYADALNNSTTWNNVESHSKSGSAVTITPTTKTAAFYVQLGAQSRISTITYDYTAGGTTYTITYNANGGTGTMASTTGADPEVSACTFTAPSGKEFSYWHTTSSGTGGTTYAAGDHPKKNADLYAIWVNQKALVSIAVTTPPTTTIYSEGQSFNPAGMVVTATFDDASTSDVTSSCTFTPSGALTTSDTSITVSYTHNAVAKTTTQAIAVKEVAHYELITDDEGLVSGCNYLIGNADQTKFMSTTQNSNNRGVHTLVGTVTDNEVGFESGMEVVTLGGSSGAWTLYANNSETTGYLYLPSNNNYLRTRDTEFSWRISFSNGTPLISATVTSERWIKYNSGSTIFSCYTSGQADISLWKEVSTAESISISKDSASGFKGDTDTTISITAVNFDPTNIEVSYSTANVASIIKGTISNKIIPLNIEFTGAGSTTATISVVGGKETYTCTLDITVAAKPDSLVVSGNDIELVDGGQTVANRRLEIQTGAEKQFSASHFTMLDTDGNNMSATASDITLSRTSGDDVVTFNGAKITAGSTPGSCVVRFASKLVSSVYYEITVNVVADYNTSVNSITYKEDLVDDQGHTLDISAVFATKIANTHFGSTSEILDSELKFSYEDNDYANAVSADSFVYDFDHGTTSAAFGEGYKDQTVFVYTTFTKSRVSSFEITIAQADNPLISISLDTGNSYNLQRNTTHQLVVSYNPSDTTDNREVVYSLSNSSTGSTITVSSTGLISAGSKVGSVATVTATVDPDQNPETENSVSASVVVTVTREAMTLTADMPASYVKVTSTADLASGKYLIVSEASNVVMTEAVNSTANKTTYENIDSSLDSYCFTYNASTGSLKGPNGSYIGKTASGNGMDVGSTEYTHTITFDNGNAVITASGGSILRYNTSWGGFRYYGSGQQAVQLYKQSGGETEVNVTDELFAVVDAAMTGSNGVYGLSLCDASGLSFNVSAWNSLGSGFTSTIIGDNKLAYARADQSGNEVEQFLYVYDYVIGKKEAGFASYSGANDFLGRVASGKITASSRVNPLVNIIGENTNTVAIIVIISMVSVTAIGGYFFLRKKEE